MYIKNKYICAINVNAMTGITTIFCRLMHAFAFVLVCFPGLLFAQTVSDRVVEIVRIDTVYIERTSPHLALDKAASHTRYPLYFAVKTNALYDLVLLPNLAVELSLGKRWSVEVEGMHSWWNTKDSKRYKHRIQLGGLEVRKWLGNQGKTPLTGHFVGAYGMGGTYDVKHEKEKGSLSNWSYSAGLTYGYAMPIARRLNLELAIGIGYVGGDYTKYTFDRAANCYSEVELFGRSYIGPTKAKVSFVWLIGRGVNTKTTHHE